MSWKIGDEAIWMYVPTGGYGIPQSVDVRILKIFETKQRTMARVEAPLANGGTKETTVRLSSLRKPKLAAEP